MPPKIIENHTYPWSRGRPLASLQAQLKGAAPVVYLAEDRGADQRTGLHFTVQRCRLENKDADQRTEVQNRKQRLGLERKCAV